MCKKLTKLVKDSEAMKEELAKYRSLYGDVDASLTVEEVRGGWGAQWYSMNMKKIFCHIICSDRAYRSVL